MSEWLKYVPSGTYAGCIAMFLMMVAGACAMVVQVSRREGRAKVVASLSMAVMGLLGGAATIGISDAEVKLRKGEVVIPHSYAWALLILIGVVVYLFVAVIVLFWRQSSPVVVSFTAFALAATTTTGSWAAFLFQRDEENLLLVGIGWTTTIVAAMLLVLFLRKWWRNRRTSATEDE